MNRDEDFSREFKSATDSIVAADELKDRIMRIPDEADESEPVQSEGKSKKALKPVLKTIAKAACIVFAIIGMGRVSVLAFGLEEPVKQIFFSDTAEEQNAKTADDKANDVQNAPKAKPDADVTSDAENNGEASGSEIESEGDYNYTISYEDMICDDVLNVGYFTVFIGKDNGCPFTSEDSSNVTEAMRCWNYKIDTGGYDPEGIDPWYLTCFYFSAGTERKYFLLYPIGNIDIERKEEDGGIRFYIRFRICDEDVILADNGLKMMILDKEGFFEVRDMILKTRTTREIAENLKTYGLSKPDYTSAYLKTVSDYRVTAQIGRTDVRVQWKTWYHIKDIVVIREDGTRLYIQKDEKIQDENNLWGMSDYFNHDLLIPYGEFLEEGEDVQIEVDGKILNPVD